MNIPEKVDLIGIIQSFEETKTNSPYGFLVWVDEPTNLIFYSSQHFDEVFRPTDGERVVFQYENVIYEHERVSHGMQATHIRPALNSPAAPAAPQT